MILLEKTAVVGVRTMVNSLLVPYSSPLSQQALI